MLSLKARITILFTAITAGLLLSFAFLIYYTSEKNREREFYNLLYNEALTKANLFLDAKVNEKTLQVIYKQNRELINEVEAAIYDDNFVLLYHDDVKTDVVKEDVEMLQTILNNEILEFYIDEWQVVGLKYTYNNQGFLVTAAGFDEYGYNKLSSLGKTLATALIAAVFLVFLIGILFSKQALSPIFRMNEQIKKITAANLHLRLKIENNKDELNALAQSFNSMLDRLENSFDSQKQFVSNISHELRTPLAAIISELEITASKERKKSAYKKAIKDALNDANKLAKLSNSLLDLAKASYDPSEIHFKKIRVDEILMESMMQVKNSNQNYKIQIEFEQEFDEEFQMSVSGNEYLLKVAFSNLIDNACKFSEDHESFVSINILNNGISLDFWDNGIGISKKDINQIFTPFYRGKNKKFTEGHGIGLHLTQKIINLHRGQIHVKSTKNVGTSFKVFLPFSFKMED